MNPVHSPGCPVGPSTRSWPPSGARDRKPPDRGRLRGGGILREPSCPSAGLGVMSRNPEVTTWISASAASLPAWRCWWGSSPASCGSWPRPGARRASPPSVAVSALPVAARRLPIASRHRRARPPNLTVASRSSEGSRMGGNDRHDRRARFGDGAAGRGDGAARGLPDRAHRLQLSDARRRLRGGGRRPGDVRPRVARLRPVRGPLVASLLAVPHRHQRLPLDARSEPAPRAADGPQSAPERRHAASAAPFRVGLDRAGAGQPCRARRRSRGRDGRARVGAAGVRCRAPVPPAPTAGRPHPPRGAALAGGGGRGAAGDLGRVGQQRAPARSGDDGQPPAGGCE